MNIDKILDGTITTFKDYVELHINNNEYPKKYDNFYHERILQIKKDIEEFRLLSDEKIIKKEIKFLQNDKNIYIRYIKEYKDQKIKIQSIIKQSKNYLAPSKNHEDFINNNILSILNEYIKNINK